MDDSDHEGENYRIVTLSDIHCGDPRFDGDLFRLAAREINALEPDLVIVAGDLTANGYLDEFVEAKEYLGLIDCANRVVAAGNHDCRNVGYLHFQDLFGPRNIAHTFDFRVCCGQKPQNQIRIVAADSNKPDLNSGEIGRGKCEWITDNFADEGLFKVFALHHHLISVPGTGRERNIVWDAGDVLAILRETEVDLALCGHKHVPNIWEMGSLLLVNSGTVSSYRTRGRTTPSYNMIDIRPMTIDVSIVTPGKTEFLTDSFPRTKAFPQSNDAPTHTVATNSGRGRN